MESVNNELPENLSPPSEWLEDTLIELYLSGYSNHARDARGTTTSDEGMPEEINDVDSFKCSVGGERIDDAYTQEGGEWIPTENDFSSEGQVYKLRTPSAAYLSSIQIYDSSNPTKDWGFPQLSTERPLQKPCKSSGSSESIMMKGNPVYMDSLGPGQLSVCPEDTKHAYRDRAAERRTLHGGFGVGPGQKSLPFAVDMAPSSPVTDNHELAAAESLNMSFGASSYPRRILESMGWQEGEALGNSVKGLIEPLQAVGNKGNAGLGWDHHSRR